MDYSKHYTSPHIIDISLLGLSQVDFQEARKVIILFCQLDDTFNLILSAVEWDSLKNNSPFNIIPQL